MDDSDGYISDSYDSDAFEANDSDSEEPVAENKGKSKVPAIEYESFSPARLQQRIEDDIRTVANIIGLESPIASILLQHFRWNRDRLIERFMDDSVAVLTDAGEPNVAPSSPNPRPSKRARLDTPTEFMCPICCDTDSANVFRSRCGHEFCETCWATYVTGKIKEEGQCLFNCMQDGCKTAVDEPSIEKLVAKGVFERYRELLLQSYVGGHATLRFCPHPGCTETVLCSGGRGASLQTEVPTVECGAGHGFCFGCGLDSDHRPIVCGLVGVWLKSAREDAGTSQWIKANTRTCPNCKNSIEKAGGCNRILCRHCKYQFCWLCMQKWEVHGYNNAVCNTWKEPEKDDAMTAAGQNLKKWLFYFDRFNNHELSSRLDQELVERAEEKVVEVQKNSNLSWIEARFMQTAVDELTKCRRTLKWSYAMAYFLAAGNEKQIFEDLQADLEKAVEDLSQLLEESVDTETIKSLRQRMMDKTVYVRMRHEVLLRDSADGLAEGRWEFTIPLD
ncbi:putative ring-finger protein ariadne-1 [Daedalea quercina L-15889]|uniref:RBR-type E3 ubiquitin transferase n=1 Tax=Daedalea quercina L-15889 TaxID=1314783 RepID=A0A165TVR4_9APHY|nr:putative ring-finger protein ariadne-1 [Daedalea quercina L-15889]